MRTALVESSGNCSVRHHALDGKLKSDLQQKTNPLGCVLVSPTLLDEVVVSIWVFSMSGEKAANASFQVKRIL